MIRLVGLLSWYRERPRDLTHMVHGLRVAGVDHLCALDGAYALYPGGTPESPPDNYRALHAACEATGIGLTAMAPDRVWAGNETEKRTSLFRLGEAHTSPADWFMVIDGDEVITSAPRDLNARLEGSPFDVAEVTFTERKKSGKVQQFPIPILFRAIRGIRVVGNHYTYQAPDGLLLWGNTRHKRLAPRLPVHDLTVDHRTRQRERDRRAAARRYYRTRDTQGTERGQCDRCDRPATRTLHTHWRPGEGGYVADFTEACPQHAAQIEAENRRTLQAFGLNPDTIRIQHRLGPAPV